MILEQFKPSWQLSINNADVDDPRISQTEDGKGLLLTTSVYILILGKDL